MADGVRGETAAWGATQLGSWTGGSRLGVYRYPGGIISPSLNTFILQIVSVAVELWKMPGQPTWSRVLTLVSASKRSVRVNTLVL